MLSFTFVLRWEPFFWMGIGFLGMFIFFRSLSWGSTRLKILKWTSFFCCLVAVIEKLAQEGFLPRSFNFIEPVALGILGLVCIILWLGYFPELLDKMPGWLLAAFLLGQIGLVYWLVSTGIPWVRGGIVWAVLFVFGPTLSAIGRRIEVTKD
jgi:hypothetical protein